MYRDCFYDEDKDLQAVDTIGWIDIAEAVQNGFVPGSINVEEMVYNEIEDPASIMTNADDVFALLRQGDYIKGFKSETANSESDAQTSTEG